MKDSFTGGVNIAVKIPKNKYDQTVSFYREVLNFTVEEIPIDNPTVSRTHRIRLSRNILWLDCVDNYTRQEIWLELNVEDIEKATRYLESKGINTCDELEQLPGNMHWIMDPAGTVFLLKAHNDREDTTGQDITTGEAD